jgi:hypothetical protein
VLVDRRSQTRLCDGITFLIRNASAVLIDGRGVCHDAPPFSDSNFSISETRHLVQPLILTGGGKLPWRAHRQIVWRQTEYLAERSLSVKYSLKLVMSESPATNSAQKKWQRLAANSVNEFRIASGSATF